MLIGAKAPSRVNEHLVGSMSGVYSSRCARTELEAACAIEIDAATAMQLDTRDEVAQQVVDSNPVQPVTRRWALFRSRCAYAGSDCSYEHNFLKLMVCNPQRRSGNFTE